VIEAAHRQGSRGQRTPYVQPSGGSGVLSLKRLRVTLHGASY